MTPNAKKALLLVLATLCALSATGCFGLDAAREAGERASGGREGAAREEPPGADAPTEETATVAAEPTAFEATGVPEEELAETTTTSLVLDPKWYKDSDGNVVPDFIEAEADGGSDMDNNPYKDDCAPERCPGAGESLEFATRTRNVLLVLDSSGSMAADDGTGTGRTKMEAAKEALSRYAGVSAALFETGFAVYGNTGDATRSGRGESCARAAEVLDPIGTVEADTFDDTLSRFEPTGWTPIEGALREAEGAFAGKEEDFNKIILVSDGLETCGGDPVAAARDLRESGIEVEVDVVGFGVPGNEGEALRQIALAGGGEYYDAGTGADLDGYFERQSRELGETWDAFICQFRNSTFDSVCDQEQCQDATIFRIPEEQQKYGINSPEYRALQDLSDRIDAGLEERERAREEAGRRADVLYEQWQKQQGAYLRAYEEAYGVS